MAAYPYTIKVKINEPTGPRWMYINRYALASLYRRQDAYTPNINHGVFFKTIDSMQAYVDMLVTRYDAPILDWKPVTIPA